MPQQSDQPTWPELAMNEAPELTLADHIPTPGACLDALWSVLPELVTAAPIREMVNGLAERLPNFDMEAGS